MIKNVGQLMKGDTFYLITMDSCDRIASVSVEIVSDVQTAKYGKIIKYSNRKFYANNTDLEKICTSPYYGLVICTNKETVIGILEEDKRMYMNNYRIMIEKLS